jgi:23S rRNA (pseudouridine1915-N3)-methyltransferase
LPREAWIIALDARGTPWSSEQLAERMAAWRMGGRDVYLLIGGAEGLDDTVLQRAHARWSLGPLTLPHMLVRVIVAEQLYRAASLLAGHPYHRG